MYRVLIGLIVVLALAAPMSASTVATSISTDEGVVGFASLESRGLETAMTYTGQLSTTGSTNFRQSVESADEFIGVASGLEFEGRNGLFSERLMSKYTPADVVKSNGCVFGEDVGCVDNSSEVQVGGFNAGRKMNVNTVSMMKGTGVQYEHSSVGIGTATVYQNEKSRKTNVNSQYMATGNYSVSHKFIH